MVQTVVLKFGGASVKDSESLLNVADIILSRKRKFQRVVAVVSAMGSTTDELIALAKTIHPDPPKRELDMLVSIGERVTMALLAMAMEKKGCKAISFTGSQTGIITTGEHHQAKIIDIKPGRILEHLEKGEIVIVAGFQGVSLQKEITTLGRGGSDTSAVALGIALGASHIEFFKDVDGIYSSDPKSSDEARLFETLSYEGALSVIRGSRHQVIHARAVELAKEVALPLQVRSFKSYFKEGSFPGTMIGSQGLMCTKENFSYELSC